MGFMKRGSCSSSVAGHMKELSNVLEIVGNQVAGALTTVGLHISGMVLIVIWCGPPRAQISILRLSPSTIIMLICHPLRTSLIEAVNTTLIICIYTTISSTTPPLRLSFGSPQYV